MIVISNSWSFGIQYRQLIVCLRIIMITLVKGDTLRKQKTSPCNIIRWLHLGFAHARLTACSMYVE